MPRIDAALKVTGMAQYTGDAPLPGMLYGKILPSPYAHATITSIDASKAMALPGVGAVVTYQDVPKSSTGAYIPYSTSSGINKYWLENTAYFVGDEVAAVAAETRHIAEDALELINVQYSQLPAVFDTTSAMASGAPLVHSGTTSNVYSTLKASVGNATNAMSSAAVTVQGTLTVPEQLTSPQETRRTLAYWDSEGKLNVFDSNQDVTGWRSTLARAFGLEMSKVRVDAKFVGGGFGCPHPFRSPGIAAMLAKKANAPVFLEYTKEQNAVCSTRSRAPGTYNITMGFNSDGTIAALQWTQTFDHGSYPGSPGWGRQFGCYNFPNADCVGYQVVTNNPHRGIFRGVADPQGHYAIEQIFDMAAEKLGIDPVQIRKVNVVEAGANPNYSKTLYGVMTGFGKPVWSCDIDDCLDQGAAAIGWTQKRHTPGALTLADGRKHGIGMAVGSHTGGTGNSSALVRVESDGTASVFTATSDSGPGDRTVWSMIAAEVLGLQMKDINPVTGDTDYSPWGCAQNGSHATLVGGSAVQLAAQQCATQLLQLAAPMLNATPAQLGLKGGNVYVLANPSSYKSIASVVATAPTAVIQGTGSWNYTKTAPPVGQGGMAWYFGAQFAEVAVDTQTGDVEILTMVSANDTGVAINPMTTESQINGANIQMQGGYALYNEPVYSAEGKLLTPTDLDHKVNTIADFINVQPIIVNDVEPYGPYGAKGIGEGANSATAGAIANAVYNAIGVRIFSIPITPSKVLSALGKLAGGV